VLNKRLSRLEFAFLMSDEQPGCLPVAGQGVEPKG